MILVIDNYDSFTFNLVQYIEEQGAQCEVKRNNDFTIEEVIPTKYDGVVISPGPCTPNETGNVLPLLAKMPKAMPLLGVCLGHQCLVQSLGGNIVRTEPFHGKISEVTHNGHYIFDGLPSKFSVARYHSLVAEAQTIPSALEVIATHGDIIMGVAEKDRPRFGLQFHPESVGTIYGRDIIRNFVQLCGGKTPF